jgi:hypothetical protein
MAQLVPPDAASPAAVENQAALWLGEVWGRELSRAVECPIAFAPRRIAAAETNPAQQELLWWEQPLT